MVELINSAHFYNQNAKFIKTELLNITQQKEKAHFSDPPKFHIRARECEFCRTKLLSISDGKIMKLSKFFRFRAQNTPIFSLLEGEIRKFISSSPGGRTNFCRFLPFEMSV